jgi:hypothetical protein
MNELAVETALIWFNPEESRVVSVMGVPVFLAATKDNWTRIKRANIKNQTYFLALMN